MSSIVAFEPGRTGAFEAHPIHLVTSLVALLEIAREEFERDREAARASITRATSLLRHELQRHETAKKADSGAGELAGWQVQRLRVYIDNHLSDTIHVKDLSGIARRSTGHFCRAFKRTFGQTPHAYVTARRVARAKSLMLESQEQLSVIAQLCGFTDQPHLSKLFRQSTGETPAAWRRHRTLEDEEASAWGRGARAPAP